jgi:hypothetical protein
LLEKRPQQKRYFTAPKIRFGTRGKETNLRLPGEFDNYPKSPLSEKLLSMHHSVLGVQTSGILKNRVVAITCIDSIFGGTLTILVF